MSETEKAQSGEIAEKEVKSTGEVSEISEKESENSQGSESETLKTGEAKGGEPTEPSQKSEEKQSAKGGVYTKEQTDELLKAYPTLDINALANDELFGSFCEGKGEGVSLKKRYEQYVKFYEDFEKRSSYRLAAARASAGSLADTSSQEDGYFTKEQVMAMSPDEIRKNYDAIRKSQNNW